MSDEYFKLVHFSDLHLSTRMNRIGMLENEGFGFSEAFGLLLKHLKSLVNSPSKITDVFGSHSDLILTGFLNDIESQENNGDVFDAFVVTGDLTSTGKPSELKMARDLLEGKRFIDGSVYAESYNFDLNKLVLLPGNHDRYCENVLKPGSMEFEKTEHFCNDWIMGRKSSPSNKQRVKTFLLSKSNKNLHILSIDFSHKSFSHFKEWLNPSLITLCSILGQGKAHKDTLKEASELSKSLSNEGDILVWAIHFNPIPSAWYIWLKNIFTKQEINTNSSCSLNLRLRDNLKLLDAAKRSNVKMILCGHTHKSNHIIYDGIHIICAGTVSGKNRKDKNEYNLINIIINDNKLEVDVQSRKALLIGNEYFFVDKI